MGSISPLHFGTLLCSSGQISSSSLLLVTTTPSQFIMSLHEPEEDKSVEGTRWDPEHLGRVDVSSVSLINKLINQIELISSSCVGSLS
jgi:hypothetical protein